MKLYICIVSMLFAISTFAQSATWQNGTGTFTDTTHWDTGSVPGIDDSATFPDGTYAVSFTRDETNSLAYFTSTDSGDQAFDLNNDTWTLTNGFVNSAGALNSKITVSDGSLIAGGTGGINISCLNDALPSYLTLVNVDSELSALVLNNAHMTIDGGYHSASERIYITSSQSTGSKITSLTLTNATLVANNSFWCGNGNTSTGIVNVLNGGFLIASNAFSVGDQKSTAVGIINVDGGDVYTHSYNWVGNAYGATAYINLYDGTFTSRTTFELGHRIQAKAHLNIYGGKFTSNSGMLVGNYQGATGGGTTGTVAITGGEFEVKGDMSLGLYSNCFGRVSIDGVSTSTLNSVKAGYGPGGYGEFYLTNGVVTLSSDLEIGTYTGSDGKVIIDGGVFSNKNANALVGLSGKGKLQINNGNTFFNGTVYAGRNSGSYGEVEVNGGELSCNNFVIGYVAGATGTYTQVEGTVETRGGDTLIANLENSYGVFTLNDGTLDVNSGFHVGNKGTGIVNLNGGSATFNNGFTSGNSSGSDGIVNITDGVVTFNGNLHSGRNTGASGSINITGGTVSNTATAYIGNQAGTTGSLTVNGGSFYSSSSMFIGNGGNGSLTLSDGDTAIMNRMFIGYYSGSTGTVTISGGSFTNQQEINVGYSGNTIGTMNISGGTNHITSSIQIGNAGNATLNISGGETVITGTRLKSATGSSSTSRINVSGGHLKVAGSSSSTGDAYLDIGGAGECIMEMTGGLVETEVLRIGTGGGTTPAVSKLIMNGGRLNVSAAQYLADTASGTGEVHLVNGVLSVNQLRGWHGHLEVTFDGGTLEARQSRGDFIENNEASPMAHILTSRGLVVDSSGYNIGTDLALPDADGENGKLTKKGEGRFTIYGTSTFTGPIIIEEGEVDLGSSGMVTLKGGVQIDGGAWLDLAARDQDFTMGAGSASRVDGTVELASGKELIFPSTSSLSGTGTLATVTMQSGSTLIKDRTTGESNLSIEDLTIEAGANVELTGYTQTEFEEGITFISGTNLDLPSEKDINFTLNGTPYDWVAVTTTSDGSGGYTVSAKTYDPGTVLVVR